MARKRYNNLNGTLSAQCLSTDISFASAALANMPIVTAPDIVVVTLDPNLPTMEIVYVTNHTASATTASITRAREGTAAATHASGAVWQHGPTVSDFEDQLVDGSTLEVNNGQHRIKDGGVTAAKLASGAVTSAALAAGAVTTAAIATGAVGSTQIANASITQSDMANNSIGSAQIIDGQVGTAELANAAVTAPKLDPNAVVPPGMIMGYAGATPPSGWLECTGAAVSRTTYANLFAVISTQYGAGDGSTTFNLPDFRGRTMIGVNNVGSGGNSALGQYIRGDSAGEEKHVLTTAELAAHTHLQNAHTHIQNGHQHGPSAASGVNNFVGYETNPSAVGALTAGAQGGTHFGLTDMQTPTNQTTTATNQNAGGGTGHNNVPPYGVARYIIKT